MFRTIQNVSPLLSAVSGDNPGADARRRQQAAHDAQVVREIIAGCPNLRVRRNLYLTSWLCVLAQALANVFLRK